VIEYNLTHITLAAVVLHLPRPFPYLVFIVSSVEGMRTEVSESELSVTLNTIAFDTATHATTGDLPGLDIAVDFLEVGGRSYLAINRTANQRDGTPGSLCRTKAQQGR
jgi:hypothetical protein